MTQRYSLTGWRLALVRLLAFVGVVALSVFLFSIRDQAAEMAGYGLPGIFLLSLVANATLILPMPGVAITFAGGTLFNPIAVGLAAGTGAALGELTGYLAGFSGRGVLKRTPVYDLLDRWTAKYGILVIFALALFPNPFFDLAGAAAGAARMPLPEFLLWSWLGKTLKMLFFAYAGANSAVWILEWLVP